MMNEYVLVEFQGCSKQLEGCQWKLTLKPSKKCRKVFRF